MNSPKPALTLVPAEPEEKTRVVGIFVRPNPEHEMRCVKAWRVREHPAWSQHHSSYRVMERKSARLRKVR